MSVTLWLDQLGLREYATVFEQEAIDFDTLPDLNDEDLRSLGLPLGHRKKILRAISSRQFQLAEEAVAPEHRRVSVLFCDLVGSTQMAQGMSAEDLRDLLADFQNACVTRIEARGGHVAKYLGDGLMAYFGYPTAHEDDAVRAVNAALDMQEAIHGVTTKNGQHLVARIGIHTGKVVAGEMGAGHTREKLSVVGEAPIIASRLEQIAGSGEIVISDAVNRLVRGYFRSEFHGSHSLKGVDAPVQTYLVRSRTQARGRIEATRRRGLSDLEGRDEELALLQARWTRVRQGDGQVVLIIGEPGIGKSRLVDRLHDEVQENGCRSLILQCSDQHTNSALFPFWDALDKSSGVTDQDNQQVRRAKILAQTEPAVGTVSAELLSDFATSPETVTEETDGAQARRSVVRALTGWLLQIPSQEPISIVFEDAHWADPSSLELLGQLVSQSREKALLISVTARPGFRADWETQHNATVLSLNRLGRVASHKIVAAQLANCSQVTHRADAIVERAEGVPLFLEELSRMARSMGHATADTDIPATLDGSLSARLDQLGSAKKVAQAGAVFGRQFPFFLMAKVLEIDGSGLEAMLEVLVEADILAKQGGPGSPSYSFTHALIQDAAYSSLLKRDRKDLHSRTASALIEISASSRFPNEMTASHLAKAEKFYEAAQYWLLAGRDAQRRSADREAIAHFRSALNTLEALPHTTQREQRELELIQALAPLILVVKGWSAEETSKVYAKARSLSQKTNSQAAMLPILYGEYLIRVSQADYAAALTLAYELLDLSKELKDEAGRLQGHRVVAWCSLYLGRLSDAKLHAGELLDLYSTSRHRKVALEYGYDPRVAGLSIQAIVAALEGQEEFSILRGQEAVGHAKHIEHASSLAYALMFACAMPAAMRNHRDEAHRFASDLFDLAEEQESALWKAYSDVILGWSGRGTGDRIKQGLNELIVTACNPWQPFFLALHADACLRNGQPDKARSLAEQAKLAVERNDERNWEPEIYRLLGQSYLKGGVSSKNEARRWIAKALDAAARSGASALKERAQNDLYTIGNQRTKH